MTGIEFKVRVWFNTFKNNYPFRDVFMKWAAQHKAWFKGLSQRKQINVMTFYGVEVLLFLITVVWLHTPVWFFITHVMLYVIVGIIAFIDANYYDRID